LLLWAIAVMLIGAYSTILWMNAVGAISSWRGLPEYEPKIASLQKQAELSLPLAIILPFIAAFLLGALRTEGHTRVSNENRDEQSIATYSDRRSREWFAPIVAYLLQLAISVAGTLILVFLLHFLGTLWLKASK